MVSAAFPSIKGEFEQYKRTPPKKNGHLCTLDKKIFMNGDYFYQHMRRKHSELLTEV